MSCSNADMKMEEFWIAGAQTNGIVAGFDCGLRFTSIAQLAAEIALGQCKIGIEFDGLSVVRDRRVRVLGNELRKTQRTLYQGVVLIKARGLSCKAPGFIDGLGRCFTPTV